MVLLVNEASDKGMVALGEKHIIGEIVKERAYHQQGNFLLLEGKPHVIEHDAEEILRIPGWRLATPEEQNQFASGKRKAGRLREAPVEEELPARTGKQPSTAGLYESLR